jgi:hypothetical protein
MLHRREQRYQRDLDRIEQWAYSLGRQAWTQLHRESPDGIRIPAEFGGKIRTVVEEHLLPGRILLPLQTEDSLRDIDEPVAALAGRFEVGGQRRVDPDAGE